MDAGGEYYIHTQQKRHTRRRDSEKVREKEEN